MTLFLFLITAYLTIGIVYSVVGVRIIGFRDTEHPERVGFGGQEIPLGVYVLCTFIWPLSLLVQILIPVLWILTRLSSIRL